MKLQLCTWPEVEEYLGEQTGIVIPIGSTEQHGPMGLIGTDALCPEIIAHHATQLHDFMVGPTLSIGMAQHHLAFPGSISLRPSTLIAVVKDIVLSLSQTGFTHIYFLNGHGGNISTVNAAFSEIYSELSFGRVASSLRPMCRLANWFTMKGIRPKIKELFHDRDGSHATPSEISITQFGYPDQIRTMDDRPAAPWVRAFTDADDYRALYPDGRMMSDSFLATPKAGQQLVDIAAEALVADYRQFLTLNAEGSR